jgi:RHS repeat-associated protein
MRTCILVLLAFAGLFSVPQASGQAASLEYCAQRTNLQPTYQCFASLAEAENFIREPGPGAASVNPYLERAEGIPLQLGSVHYTYRIKPRKYAVSLGDFYSLHLNFVGGAPKRDCGGNPVPVPGINHTGCDTDEELRLNVLAGWPYYNSPEITAAYEGSYSSQTPETWGSFTYISQTQRGYVVRTTSRDLVITPGGKRHTAYRSEYFECPEHFLAISSNASEPTSWPRVCRNSTAAYISIVSRQYDTCHKDGNPCVPATGNKEYRVTDFEWEGISFKRAYNSISDLALRSGMSDNWTHTFSDRLLTTSNVTTDITWIRSDGYYEVFSKVSDTVYRSRNQAGNMLVRALTSTGATHSWRLLQADRSVLGFSAAGRLNSYQVGSRTYSLQYCSRLDEALGKCSGFEELSEIRSSSGRSLKLGYEALDISLGTGTLNQDRLRSIVDEAGTPLVQYFYDAFGRLRYARYPAGSELSYAYGEPANICRSASTTCDPARFGQLLTGVSDSHGIRVANYAYDERGRVVLSEGANATNSVALNYHASGEVDVRLPLGAMKRYTFATGAFRKPSRISLSGDSTLQEESFVASDFRLTSHTSADGSRRSLAYDSYRSTGATHFSPNGTPLRTTTSRWNDALNRPIEVSTLDSQGQGLAIAAYSYDSLGQVLTFTRTDPASGQTRATTNTYCEQPGVDAGTCPRVGLLLSVDGPRTDIADITRYTYYPSDAPGCDTSPATCAYRKGDLWAVENAMGHISETLRYDGAGRPLQTKDANGVITDLEYHPRGWLTARKVRGDAGSGDAVMRIDYWPTGLVRQVTQPDGTFTTYTYDDAHRLTAIADNAGNKIEYTLDNAGNRTKEDTKDAQGALKRTLSRVYNQLGQLQTARDAYSVATGFTYDASGNTDTVTDAKNRVTDNDYDPLSRLTRTLQDTAGIRAETKFEYDALDNLTRVVDPKGLATTYTYNGLGDMTQLTSPDTGTTTYTYDSAGNRASQTDARGITTQYLYDALNRLTQVLYASPSLNTTYYYDTVNAVCAAGENFALGRLGRMADASGSTQYCYDRWGNLVRKVQTTNGRVFTTRYAYNLAGRLTRMVYPSGMVVDYGINSLGQPSSITVTRPGQAPETLVRSVKYHAFGPVSEIAYGTNGRVQRRGVDANYRPNVVEDGVSLNLGLGWDEVGNLTSLVDTHPSNAIAAPLRGYRYDALNRLDQVRNGATNSVLQTYTYDATGNRTSFKSGTSTTQAYTYPTTSHRLTQAGTTARTYDAVGNTVSIGGTAREFIFDATNRMSQLKKNGAVSMNYAYNGKGERVRRFTTATSTAQTYSVYDEAGHWIGEYSSTGTTRQEYIWLDDLPVGLHAPTPASTTTFQLYHVQADHLGTPRTVIDPVRSVAVWSWALTGEAFGNSTPVQDPDADGKTLVFDMRFPGQRYDSATLISYNMHRDYEAGTGRYTQSDPIGLNGGLNTYRYSYANPLVYFDPSGLAPQCRPLISIGGGSEDVLISRDIISDSGWRLQRVSVDPPAPGRPMMGRANFSQQGGLGGLMGTQVGDCWGSRVRTYRESYETQKLTHLLEMCTEMDCGTPRAFLRTRTDRQVIGTFERVDRDMELQTNRMSGVVLYLKCLEWLKTLR